MRSLLFVVNRNSVFTLLSCNDVIDDCLNVHSVSPRVSQRVGVMLRSTVVNSFLGFQYFDSQLF